MIPLGGYGRCHPTLPPRQNITAHKRGQKNNTQILSSPQSVAWNLSLEELNGSPRCIVSSNGLFIFAVSHMHYQTFCLLARCTCVSRRPSCEGLLESWTGVKPSKKKRLSRGKRQQLWVWHSCLDHTDHWGLSHENILLSVYLINATWHWERL